MCSFLHISIQRCEKCPNLADKTLSPLLNKFVSAASHPLEPVPGNIIGCADVVSKTFFKSFISGCQNLSIPGARWSSFEISMACLTLSGMFVGPGTKSEVLPGIIYSISFLYK